jgi:hypothetical protein
LTAIYCKYTKYTATTIQVKKSGAGKNMRNGFFIEIAFFFSRMLARF